jgi:carboxypeptidase T
VEVRGNTPEQLDYHSYSTLVSDLNQLASDYPDIAKVYYIGTSVEGRQIPAIKISDNAASDVDEGENKILFTGTHHAREWISLEVPYLLAEYLIEHHSDTDIRPLIDNQEIWIVPLLNPDGHEYSRTNDRQWRKNRQPIEPSTGCYGVDLNRNYGASTWGTINDIHNWPWPCWPRWPLDFTDTYRGPSRFSEPETQVIESFFQTRHIDAVLSYHSYTQLILWPWGHTKDPIGNAADREFMKSLGRQMRALIWSVHNEVYQPQQSSELYRTAGDLTDWSYETYGIPSFTIELRPQLGDPEGFELPAEQIDETFEENLPAALQLLRHYLPNIDSPTSLNPVNAGPHDNPRKIFVEIAGIGKDRTNTDFAVKIGGLQGTVVSAARTGVNRYTLGLMPPLQSANGVYDLEIIVGGASATQVDAVNYADVSNADIVLVLDRSGSMGASGYLEPAKTASKQFVRFMQDGDQLGVVSFDQLSNVDFPLTTIVGDITRQQAEAAIDAIAEGGRTSIGSGLQTAQNQLVTSGDVLHPWAIVLLSDGYENEPPWVADVLPGIIASKTVVHTIGLGPNSDQDLLLDIGAQTGGTYSYAPGADELARIYNTIIGQVSGQQTLFSEPGIVQQGQFDEKGLIVDDGLFEATFSVTWPDSGTDIDLTLVRPNGNVIDPDVAASNPDIEFYSGSTFEYYRVRGPMEGTWTMRMYGASVPLAVQNMPLWSGYTVLVTAHTDTTLDFYHDLHTYLTGDHILLTAALADQEPILGATINVVAASPTFDIGSTSPKEEWLQVGKDSRPPQTALLMPDTITHTVPLYDDGLHNDGTARDGVYANVFRNTSVAGIYKFDLEAAGISNSGSSFTRLASTTARVTEPPILAVDVIGSSTDAAQPGEVLTMSFTVKNTGDQWDTFDLRAGEVELILGWADTSQIPEAVSLSPGQSVSYEVEVVVPVDAPRGSLFALHLVASSQNDLDASDLATIEVSLPSYEAYLPSICKTLGQSVPTWTTGTGLNGQTIYALALHPADCNILYAGTANGIYGSGNVGQTWVPVGLQTLSSTSADGTAFGRDGTESMLIPAVAIDPTNAQTMYAATWGAGVYKTTDGGAFWFPANNGLGDKQWLYALWFDAAGQALYAGTGDGGVYKTTNSGASWFPVNAGLEDWNIRALVGDPVQSQVLYAGTQAGIYKTTNGGTSWVYASSGLGTPTVWALAVDATNPQVLYAGVGGGGVYKSSNGGASWVAVNIGLGTPTVYGLAVDPHRPQSVYAGTAGQGVYRSDNGGGSWSAANAGLGNLVIQVLGMDGGACHILHAGTGNGVWEYQP